MSDLDKFVDFAFVAFIFGIPALFVAALLVICTVVGIGAVIEWFDKRKTQR